MGHAEFRVGELTAVIGDNAEYGEHRAGYNGVWSLRHGGSRSVFIPRYVGLNHEHIFNGETEDNRDWFFTPRISPMTFQRLSETAGELHQPATPMFHLERRTRFELKPPYYLEARTVLRPRCSSDEILGEYQRRAKAL